MTRAENGALHPVVAIIPACNEAAAIGKVVRAALALQIFERVIVANNASTDGTGDCARRAGAVVVHEPQRGYGAACLAALTQIGAARTVVFIDGDCSVDVAQTARLLEPLSDGADLAIGVRINGRERGMTLPQRLGNELATLLIRMLWRVRVSDLGPFRAVRVSALRLIDMRDRGYGWTVEMQVKAIQLGLRVAEVPVDVLPRVGASKISGTVRGVIGAAIGIFGMIGRLWWAQNNPKMPHPLAALSTPKTVRVKNQWY